jgi:hypothetical protein
MGYHMLDFLRGMKRTMVFLLVLGCSFVLGCKSPSNQAEAEKAKKVPARPAREDNSGSADPSGYQRTVTRSANENADDEEKKENYEGGDPDIFHPPVHPARPRERVVEGKPSTPTPTPNRPIDRPLDPSGKPLTSPTPEG